MYFKSLPVMIESGFTSRHKSNPTMKQIMRMRTEYLLTRANHTRKIGEQTSAIVKSSIIDAMKVFISVYIK